MWYKRYGYKQPSSEGGIGCLGALASMMVALTVSLFFVALFDNAFFLLLLVPVSFLGFWISERSILGKRLLIPIKRHRYHIVKSRKYIQSGMQAKALDSIRKARIYGELPEDLKAYEQSRLTSLGKGTH